MKNKRITLMIWLGAIIILALFVMPFNQVVYANSNNHREIGGNGAVKAFLRNDKTGERVILPVKITNGKEANSTIFEVFIPSTILDYETHSRTDTTGGVTLTITQYYTAHYIGGLSASLDGSYAKWTKSDGTISITNAQVTSAIWGYKADGSGFYSNNEQRWIGVPSLNTWYSQIPSFKGIFVVIDGFGYIESYASSTLVRGGSSWGLGFCVSQGGNDMINCE